MALGAVEWVKETTAGTPITTTTQTLQDDYSFEWGDDPTINQPEFVDGTIAMHSNGSTLGTIAHATLNMALDFEQLPWFLSTGIKAVAAVPDAGTPIAYTYTFLPTLTTTNDTINSGTYKFKADSQIEYMEYGTMQNFTIGVAAPHSRTDFTVNLFGRQVTTTTLTSPSSAATELVSGDKWALKLDDTGGTIGTTAYTGCLKSFQFSSGDLELPSFCIKDQAYFETVSRPKLMPQLTINVAIDSALAGLLTDMRAGTRQLIQLQATGTQIHAAPAVLKTVTIQMAGRLMAPAHTNTQTVTEAQFTKQFTFSGERDTTWGKLFQVIVINSEATLRV